MTAPQPAASRRGPLLAIAAIVILAVAGIGLWYLFFRPAGPAPVSLGSTTPDRGGQAPRPSPRRGRPSLASTPHRRPVHGAVARPADRRDVGVDPSVGSFDDFSGSFVGYRVQEELASVGATEAVGRTPDVTGLAHRRRHDHHRARVHRRPHDAPERRGQSRPPARRQGLETGTYPTATFTLTQPIELGSSRPRAPRSTRPPSAT
jgi:hypothetical protein